MFNLKPPRHISTLPSTALTALKRDFRSVPESRHSRCSLACLERAIKFAKVAVYEGTRTAGASK